MKSKMFIESDGKMEIQPAVTSDIILKNCVIKGVSSEGFNIVTADKGTFEGNTFSRLNSAEKGKAQL